MSDVSLQAARWFTRLLDLPEHHPDRAAFAHWLQQDPRHAEEFAEFSALWQGFADTGTTASLALGMEGARRRRLLGGGLMLLTGISSLAGWLAWRQWGLTEQYFTGTGQTQRTLLADGSEIVLDADTRLQVRYAAGARQVWLLAGRALFDVRRAPQRPFTVDAGIAQVQVLGTRFAVERLTDRVQVSVQHGRVAVSDEHRRLHLSAGEVAECSRRDGLHRLARDASAAFAFTQGSLVFDDASMAEVAAVLSRYRRTPVRVRGEPPQRLSAVVQTADVEAFIERLPSLTTLTLREQDDATYLIQ